MLALLLCCRLAPGLDAYAAEAGGDRAALMGNVVKVFDGDSLVVRAAHQDLEVRLADVDAPEKGQPYADQARRALTSLVYHRKVTIEVLDVDQYHRKVARVRRSGDGLDINTEVVRLGNAWVYRRYVRDQALFAVEQIARQQRAGLWALPEDQRIPPWVYRELGRKRLQ